MASRRLFLAGMAGALAAPSIARASGSMTAAIYPGTWD